MIDTAAQSRVLTAYRNRLAGLAGMKGQRNASLLGICNLGVLAGLPDCQIEQEIRDASGNPPLTVSEVRHALRKARMDVQPLASRPDACRTWEPPPPKPPPLGAGAVSFVRRMIARGTGAALSPVPVPTDPEEQTALFLETLYKPDEFLFIGDQYDRGKIGATVRTCAEWTEFIRAGGKAAPLMIGNPLTGRQGLTKEGKPSFRCTACVEAFRYALVEFDALPIPDQCAFWQGVINAKVLPLRALTYSGGKSIHGLIQIDAPDRAAWDKQMEVLLYAVSHPDAPKEYQADRACKNPDRMTRLPGATRPDKGSVQNLLWLAG
ncbi:MAG TPA: hypothetical protein P5527_05540 [Kiritimatiellia bacterium]|nr:hypothetical protein [Kiritimatiellia bacterium]